MKKSLENKLNTVGTLFIYGAKDLVENKALYLCTAAIATVELVNTRSVAKATEAAAEYMGKAIILNGIFYVVAGTAAGALSEGEED